MLDQASASTTGLTTQVTSLMARLRDSAPAGDEAGAVHESDLWSPPAGVPACGLLVLEIDSFSRYALDRGDRFACALLEAVEARLARNVRPADTVTPLSRGQFAIILDAATSAEETFAAAHTLLRCFDDPVATAAGSARLTASIGIAISADWTSTGAMIGAALREVDAVKRNGGNGIKSALPCRVPSSPAPHRYAILESA